MSTRSVNRRDFLKTAGAGALSLSLSSLTRCTQIQKNPNVLFIAVDDLRPQIGCYGHKQMISPNIDRIAEQGTIFSRTFCQVPVCGASRASLLTGVRPTRTRFINYYTSVDEDLPTVTSLPKHFKNNGYTTLSRGKIYHHYNDDKESWSDPDWRPTGHWRDYQSEQSVAIASKTENFDGPAYENVDVPDSAYFDGRIADKAIEDLNRLKSEQKPFFLAVGFKKPHLPFNAPKKYWDLYKSEQIDLADNPFRPKDCPDAALHNWGELRAYHNIPKEGPLSDEMARTLIHGYYACVSYTDAQIGRLLDELEKLGLADNTVIVLWGDHGWNLGEHGLWCKHCNFETSLHSPLIVSAPGYRGGQSCNALTEFVDIYPSLCDLCNLPLPLHLEGSSFKLLMKNPKLDWKKATFSRYQNGDSIKTDRYRYTEYSNDDGEIYARMLYDHTVDLAENENISEKEENKQLVAKLSKMLHDGWQEVKI